MNTIKQSFEGLNAWRHVILLLVVSWLSACSVSPQVSPHLSGTEQPGIVVVGAVAKTGLKAAIDVSRMSTDLAALLAGTGAVVATPASVVRTVIGSGPHDEMLAFYARQGQLAPYHVQRLMAARLPSSRALVVRLESDHVDYLPVMKKSVIDSEGLNVSDRERHIFTTRRTTQMSAMLLDLRNGRTLWTRQYRVSPESTIAANHHIGGSFSASLAATVANTMVHGIDEKQHPEPPELSGSVLALLQEVAYNVPFK